jgi:anti-sigma regulatory factor (Ser/Thr protein kinase)
MVSVAVVSQSEEELVEFRHEVAFYEGLTGLPSALLPFLLEGVANGEPMLVVMLPDRLLVLRDAMGALAGRVEWVDMTTVGANPACIIPAWCAFLDRHAGEGPVRGIGEPIWDGRRGAEMAEAELHEALLNVAFDHGPGWRLLCPYDVKALPEDVLEEALRNHPVRDLAEPIAPYAGHEHAARTFSRELPAAPSDATTLAFGPDDLGTVRGVVRRACETARLHPSAVDDVVLAAHELAANSVQHAGNGGSLLVWDEPGALVLEVRDHGHIDDPLVGRNPLDLASEHGRGIWMANQLCDLVQVRSGGHGTQVRLYAWL